MEGIVTQHLLVRWPDRRPLPRGTIGRYRTVAAREFAVIADRPLFEEWAYIAGLGDEHGNVSPQVVEDARAVVAAGGRVPGIVLRTDGRYRLRVWPISVRNVDELDAFMWESAVDVVKPRPARRVRSARRARWRR
jgi:hypothetical protein